ncbi:MAG TPA: hypothetical protein VN280_14490, partial [Variovorax sp.]|nr:hypothetical protein [Variovorax sp.]
PGLLLSSSTFATRTRRRHAMSTHRIAVIAGDGIGMETVPEGLRVLWGEHGAVGRCFDVLSLWRECAADVSGRALPCGHYVPEEAPGELLAEALQFFTSPLPQEGTRP